MRLWQGGLTRSHRPIHSRLNPMRTSITDVLFPYEYGTKPAAPALVISGGSSRPWAVCDDSERWSWRAASTSAAPVPFAGLNGTAGAFGYLPQCLEMRDSGLLGRPRSNDPFLAIWLDGFNPIGTAEWNDPVGLHEARYGDDRLRDATPNDG